jgi:integrase
MRGVLHQPLHTQIDSVRTYREERLPYPVQWRELQQLLRRIDRSTPLGSRDYAVLLLAATYGMRASDVANLTLADVDWRERKIQIVQCKTRQPLSLPLTDEVGAALVNYLQRGRPASACRQIFLRSLAPIAPLSLTGMSQTLRRASHTVRRVSGSRGGAGGVGVKANALPPASFIVSAWGSIPAKVWKRVLFAIASLSLDSMRFNAAAVPTGFAAAGSCHKPRKQR